MDSVNWFSVMVCRHKGRKKTKLRSIIECVSIISIKYSFIFTIPGHDIFYKSGDFSAEQFRSYRIVCIRQFEQLINRNLTATEQEVLLFPLICNESKCREHRLKRLARCTRCGEVAYCQDKPQHLNASHAAWCPIYRLFKTFVMLQAKFGRIEPPLPDEVLRELPSSCSDSRQIMQKLNFCE